MVHIKACFLCLFLNCVYVLRLWEAIKNVAKKAKKNENEKWKMKNEKKNEKKMRKKWEKNEKKMRKKWKKWTENSLLSIGSIDNTNLHSAMTSFYIHSWIGSEGGWMSVPGFDQRTAMIIARGYTMNPNKLKYNYGTYNYNTWKWQHLNLGTLNKNK